MPIPPNTADTGKYDFPPLWPKPRPSSSIVQDFIAWSPAWLFYPLLVIVIVGFLALVNWGVGRAFTSVASITVKCDHGHIVKHKGNTTIIVCPRG